MPTHSGPPPFASRDDRLSPLPMMPSDAQGELGSRRPVAQLELGFDQRSSAIFHQWLRSLATDAEAALAAAMSYREMSPSGRNHWLASLEKDLSAVDVPKVAVYAPLLAVEQDPERRRWLEASVAEEEDRTEIVASRVSLVASKNNGEKIFVVVCPLYLQFVQVLACAVKDGCFTWVRHDPIVSTVGAPVAGDLIKGVQLEQVAFHLAMDELAAAILSHQRQGLPLPEAVFMLTDLLGGIGP